MPSRFSPMGARRCLQNPSDCGNMKYAMAMMKQGRGAPVQSTVGMSRESCLGWEQELACG